MVAGRENENSEYLRRVNRVLDYLDENYSEELSLESLAGIANFSPYHFHRIFKGIVGESLFKYTQRIRVEKAANFLKYQSNRTVSDIASECGFGSPASFARTFKEYYGVSATEWKKGTHKEYSKNRKVPSKDCEEVSKSWKGIIVSSLYIDPSTNNSRWRVNMLNRSAISIEVKKLPQVSVAYIRHIGEFKGETEKWAALFHRLMKWGGARGLLKCPGTEFFTVFRDDLNLTDYAKFKADVCISVDSNTKPDGEVGVSIIPAGAYAVASFEIDGDEFEQAWDLVYSEWLPSSGYQPDERCCFERYLNDPKLHPKNKHVIEVCIPVRPL
ncbi:MAG: AraC family transcriptional regulator [Gammaproteobacteria bacterium]|nr:AraC family transcriptional regulator [Gammaproteobacteria bacterium]MDH5802155.1 AraC family transcriptional regulator [Gammaproteobacteria bacterium]